ncbi:MAG TPA: allantoinase AllB [Pyrinomonadaceae bacterium]|jgi:allantoinase
MPDLIIRGRRVVTNETIAPAAIHIKGGVISAVTDFDDLADGARVIEASDDCIVMAGLVDTHVHINEPGRTDWEGFETATRAAAAGGVTTLVDMPLNNIPATTTLKAFELKLEAARGKLSVDTAFWGGVVPGNVQELEKLFAAGVVGFKCFLIHSGVDDFPNVTEEELRAALKELASLDALLIVHAECPAPVEKATDAQAASGADPRRYETFLRTRPKEAEDEAVALVLRLSRETGARVHIVHHSSSSALGMLREAKSEGVRVTLETCPHYLSFVAEEIADGATEYKCCPPIRERANSEELWSALDEGLIEMVVSDHSPCPADMKCGESGNFLEAWGGISSLQLRLPVMWTEMRERGYAVGRLAEWLARAPARLAGLERRKGSLAVGSDADIVIWNPDEEFQVEPRMLHHRHKLTPYRGRKLSGVVKRTFLRGRMIYEDGEFSSEPVGTILKRGSF